MMKSVLSALALLVFCTHAMASDDCTLNLKAIRSAIDVKSDGFTSLSQAVLNKKERTITQTGTLKATGMPVRYQSGGCEHFSFAFRYALPSRPTAPDLKLALIDLAKSNLNATPTTDDGKNQKDIMINALSDSSKVTLSPLTQSDLEPVYDIPCGDASCTMFLKDGNLQVDYSMPL